ncbi:MAG: alpha/beta hydrolase fold domain-containing protein [Nodosilinea sp.]
MISLLLSGVGLFLSLWIVVPAPTRLWLPLGVGATEICLWLVGLNTLALALALSQPQGGGRTTALVLGGLALGLSALPLVQFPAANARIAAEMQARLGPNYLATVPTAVTQNFRPRPLVLADGLRGINIAPVHIERDIEFARPAGASLTLNVYRPMILAAYPALVVIYGGAWQSGTPASHETFSRYMAAQGYTVVAIDYRHAPQYRFPAQTEDVQTALAYIQQQAATLGVDLDRTALLGRSAGGHLAAIAAYNSPPIPIRAVVNYYGPVDLLEGYSDPPVPDPIDTQAVLRTFLGGTPTELPALYRQASPIRYVKPNLPPTLLVYGGRDHLVQARYGRRLYEQLRANGNTAVWLGIPWAEHAFDTVFNGVSNQLALYYTERFLAWALRG